MQVLRTNGVAGRSCSTRSNLVRSQPRARTIVASAVHSAEELNSKYGIKGAVSIESGNAGSTKVVLKHNNGCSAEVYLFGAVVSSFKQSSGDEVLYVRPDAVFDKSKPISGGIPHCFPQFGPGPMQQHGFARNLDWSIATTSANPNPDDADPTVELVLSESDYTLKMWPHKFNIVYTVALHGEQLQLQLRVINTDDKEFDFTAALHTYIEVLNIGQAKVNGLQGLTYLDKSKDPKNPETKTQTEEAVDFSSGYVDRVYLDAPNHVELDVGTGAAVAIDSQGWTDAVVWNPHLTMKECYEKFACVEQAKTGSPVVLAPGKSWEAQASFSVVELAA
eukprot:CAMPEP_0119104222 /NCGR_PEP_ID=MMETSP1180-20130426/2482_1 /TAXON_ID=3052 ORGANISM="Chlamydomonas cf sp, Strain CCMP681" /NCGR_SAMPLE_ID=MMETSP1180 /ASSEMBLY_ACC=CAM_ASM_000741 /LENGTH=333 /DNA_ID=CAMNT_0007088911 /DNA_START=29 /DNA_END=1030 /DNA_ORIENTATION=-